jgi:hypothetical protein
VALAHRCSNFSAEAPVNTVSNLAHYQKPAEQRTEHRAVDKPFMQAKKL